MTTQPPATRKGKRASARAETTSEGEFQPERARAAVASKDTSAATPRKVATRDDAPKADRKAAVRATARAKRSDKSASQANDTATGDPATAAPQLPEAGLTGVDADAQGAPLDDALLAVSEAIAATSASQAFIATDYYFQHWGRFGLKGRNEPSDDFGRDPASEARLAPALDFLYERYFRVDLEGAGYLPTDGAALLVSNHGGALPWDGLILKMAIARARAGRSLRWLMEDHVFHAPFLGSWLNRLGAVRACPQNAERLLERGELLAVFPEGIKGIEKLFRERYQLQRFGRGGHIKLALRMGVPVIPIAIVGSEESYPLLRRVHAFSKTLGVPFIPVTPLFPWLGPLGLLPLPSRWRIAVGEPMRALEGLSPSAADDSGLVHDLNEQLRGSVQSLLQRTLRERGPAFRFGSPLVRPVPTGGVSG